MRRRDLLKLSAAAAPAVIAGRAWAAPQAGARLLVVFLRGGYDAANVVIPTGSDFYYQARPTLQIARPDPANPHAALPLDADWSLHPALRDSLYPLWRKRQVAFVPFTGSDDTSRSHFQSQDTMELGLPLRGPREESSGFMSRLWSQLADTRAIAFTDQRPLAFKGGRAAPNIALRASNRSLVDGRQARLIESMYAGAPLGRSVNEGFRVRDQVLHDGEGEPGVSRGAVSPGGFEAAGGRIARLMRTDYNLAFVDVGGWDTHVNQGAATGYLASRLGELGRGLAAFADGLGPAAWNETVVVVISEFGRTFREHGDKGTDHGRGSAYWVLGGQVRGGRVAGPQVRLTEATLNEHRDYPVLTDYRALLGGVARRLYGLDGARIDKVFPASPPKDLALI
jgi:uncharacterized protein (DUF1501 family)